MLGQLQRAPPACLALLAVGDPSRYVSPLGWTERFVVFAQTLGLFEHLEQFLGESYLARSSVRLQTESGHHAKPGVTAFLHFLVHQQHVVAAARGKKRGAKRESVYFAADS